MSLDRVVVVGASVAGVNAAEELRRHGYGGAITLLDSQDERPHDKPPLSKQFLTGAGNREDVALRDESFYRDLDVELRTGTAAVRLDATTRTLTTSTGEALPFDAVVLATGSTARWPAVLPRMSGMYTLRNVADADAIRRGLEAAVHLVVIGGGFIGAEVAASARKLGVAVTIIESASAPMGRVLGSTVGNAMAAIHRDQGVIVRTDVQVAEVCGRDSVEQLVLSDGTVVDTDLVVVGVGAAPATDWLRGSGVELADGVVADQFCETAISGVYAAGDVARWQHPAWGSMRVEHYNNAVEQGALVARNLVLGGGDRVPYAPLSYVWSDQYDHTLQILGNCASADDQRLLDGSLEARNFVIGCFRGDHLVGAIGLDARRQLMRAGGLVSAQARTAEVATLYPAMAATSGRP